MTRQLFPLFICLALSGCGGESLDSVFSMLPSLSHFKKSNVWLEKISFKASDNVNDFSPVTIHIVIPYKKELYDELLKLSADEYFQKIDQIKLDNRGQIDIFSWDIVRGQRLEGLPISPSGISGEGVIMFAHYHTPGPHRLVLADEKEVSIYLDKNDFKVIQIQS